MASIKDHKGFNQGFKPTRALKVRTQRRCDLIDRQIAGHDGVEILEIGCGTGDLSFLLSLKPGRNVVGSDVSPLFIEEALRTHARDNLEYRILDFRNAGNEEFLRGRCFDYIVGNGILHHLYHEMDAALKDLYLLLKPGGRIIFWEPNLLNPYCLFIFRTGTGRRLANLEPGEMAFGRRFITEKLLDNGFSDISFQYLDFLLPVTPGFMIRPVILLGKVMEKLPVANRLAQSVFIMAAKPSGPGQA